MAKTAKRDIPLLLRSRNDGRLHLDARPGDKPAWPPRHEFPTDWLLTTPEASVVDGTIVLELANGRAVYDIVESVTIDDEERTSTGMWGVLSEGTVN